MEGSKLESGKVVSSFRQDVKVSPAHLPPPALPHVNLTRPGLGYAGDVLAGQVFEAGD